MAKFKVISVGDRYCVMKFNDDGLYTVVKGSYRETWKGAEAHMEALKFQDTKGVWIRDEMFSGRRTRWDGLAFVAGLASFVFGYVLVQFFF